MKMIDEIKQWGAKDWLKALIIIAGVVSIGLFGLNQFVAYQYKAVFLQTPCDLCRSLVPEVEGCFWNKIEIEGATFPNIDLGEQLKINKEWQPVAPLN